MSPLESSISGIITTSPEPYNSGQNNENENFTVCFKLGFDKYNLCYPQTLVLFDVSSVIVAKRKFPLARKVTCYGHSVSKPDDEQPIFRAKCISMERGFEKPIHKRVLELRRAW